MSQQHSGAAIGASVAESVSEDSIADYLKSHPDFFERHAPLVLGLKLPHRAGGAAISLDGLSAWVLSKQDNIKCGSLRNGGVLTHDMTVRSIASRIVLASQSEDLAGRIDFDDAGIASAATFDPNGIFLFTAMEGSREVAMTDA